METIEIFNNTNKNKGFSKDGSNDGKNKRRAFLKNKGHKLNALYNESSDFDVASLNGNIENFIGFSQIPVGLAGPLSIEGSEAFGEYYIPLATTEGALVASYNRGLKAIKDSGGVISICLDEAVQRSPYFKFKSIQEANNFSNWVLSKELIFHKIVLDNSNYAELKNIKTKQEGNAVILTFEYKCGEAAGQNMVTICTKAICTYILNNYRTQPTLWYIESNFSGDKKACFSNFQNVRGKNVSCEVVLKKEIVKSVLKTTPQAIINYWNVSTMAMLQSGAIGNNGHIANALTALFIACGQDVACVAESAVGINRFELTENGDLYAALTLPSLIVGTVGGGTSLPGQNQCLQLLDCTGKNSAIKFAEICCAVALAGEISIGAAIAEKHFTNAHKTLGRKS